MRLRWSYFFLALLLASACVDRIDLDTGIIDYPIIVEGFISDKPGPYEIRVSRSFDIQSKAVTKLSVSARKIIVSDDVGNSEVLTELNQGVYQTNPSGIQGKVGNTYKLRVELLDGRVYESVPETLQKSGTVDDVYFSFVNEERADFTTEYGFDVFFNSTASVNADHFLWKFTGTYQIDTNPEAHTEPCGESRCPRPRPCSGWVVINGFTLEQRAPCECCTCWVDFSNETPLISDNLLVQGGKYLNVSAYRVPLTQWIFMHKVYVRVEQMSLSPRAFAFWQAIKSQKEATGSLFQPITGIVPNNFVQVAGTQGKLEGFFFATSIHSKGVFITRQNVPNELMIPKRELPFQESCLAFPNSTNKIPDFWK